MNFKHGNILEATENIIVHQVNNLGIMGAGLALQIKNKWPDVYTEYKKYIHQMNTINSTKHTLIGSIQLVLINDNQVIINMFSQNGISRTKRTTDYDAMEQCFKQIQKIIQGTEHTVAIPYKIGCGLAGGDWNIVQNLIEKYLPNTTIYKL